MVRCSVPSRVGVGVPADEDVVLWSWEYDAVSKLGMLPRDELIERGNSRAVVVL